jgi:hypothetical protein
VAITAGGTIVVSDLSAFGIGGLIAVNPGTGQQTKVPASTVFSRPMGIVADGSGQVVVAYLGQPGGVDGKVMRVNGAILAADAANGVIRIEGLAQTTVSAGGSFARPLPLTVAR